MMFYISFANVTQLFVNPLTASNLLEVLSYFRIFYEVVAIGHNKSWTASGCRKYLAGPLDQLGIYCWPKGPARFVFLAGSKILKSLILAAVNVLNPVNPTNNCGVQNIQVLSLKLKCNVLSPYLCN